MRRERDGRILEVLLDADGGALIVNDDEPTKQSAYLSERELRWLCLHAPMILLKAWWGRDGGPYDHLHRTAFRG